MRHVWIAVAVASFGVVAGERAGRACSKPHQSPFELFERAAVVAEVTVTSVPATKHGGGAVGLAVHDSIKGTPGKTTTAQESGTSCRAGYRKGKRALVFLDAKGRTVGHYEGYRELAKGSDLVKVIKAWAAARDDAARLAVLLDAIDGAGTSVEMAREAAYHLGERPDLLALIGEVERDRLVAALATADKSSTLPVVLVRLRDARVVAALDAEEWSYEDIARQFLARDYEAISDRDALADLVAKGKGEESPDRASALERCERVLGRSVERFWFYAGGVAEHHWLTLAERCRTGKGGPD